MDSVINAVHIVLSIFTMIGIGMFLTHLGWLNDKNSSLISSLVTMKSTCDIAPRRISFSYLFSAVMFVPTPTARPMARRRSRA